MVFGSIRPLSWLFHADFMQIACVLQCARWHDGHLDLAREGVEHLGVALRHLVDQGHEPVGATALALPA